MICKGFDLKIFTLLIFFILYSRSLVKRQIIYKSHVVKSMASEKQAKPWKSSSKYMKFPSFPTLKEKHLTSSTHAGRQCYLWNEKVHFYIKVCCLADPWSYCLLILRPRLLVIFPLKANYCNPVFGFNSCTCITQSGPLVLCNYYSHVEAILDWW